MLRRALAPTVLLISGLIASAMAFVPVAAAAPAEQAASGPLTIEWLGWSHYRFTSPTGKVILTNPFTSNPDSPIKAEDVDKADLIVVADGHGDEVGSTVEIANQTGRDGARAWRRQSAGSSSRACRARRCPRRSSSPAIATPASRA